MRENIEFKTEDGVTLRGWEYLPEEGGGPFPTIVMAHGFSGTKEMYLDDYAARFAAFGHAVLVYDNRGFGESDGEPRTHIDPWRQINDYRDAITFAGLREEMDAARIGIWGSSYSGGHVIVVAAIDRRVKCVISQVPLVSGLETARRLIPADRWSDLRARFDADRRSRFEGTGRATVPVVGAAPGDSCALPTADSREFFMRITKEREVNWKNEVTLQSVELFTEYEPAAYIGDICPTPLLMVLALEDHLTPYDLAAKAYERAQEPKQLLTLPGGHFDAYVGDNFATSSQAQGEWFAKHL